MPPLPSRCCCVCGLHDERALVTVALAGAGGQATLCGSHALMHSRARVALQSEAELRELLRDRRGGRDRRTVGDVLGEALIQAFGSERRDGHRRRDPAP